MDREWNDSQPIYRQLRDRVVAMILDGVLKEGDPLPSVRNVAAEYRVNPLTVLKGYQQLVDEGLVESRARPRHVHQCRRTQSVAAKANGRSFLPKNGRGSTQPFERLGLKPEELLTAAKRRPSSDRAQSKTRRVEAPQRGALKPWHA